MVAEDLQGLLGEAEATYTRVVLDPARYARQAQEVVVRAQRDANSEALLVGLRAQAWARHAVLDNAGAAKLLGQGLRLAERLGLRQRLGELLVTRAVALHELGRHDAAARDLHRAETLVAPADRPEVRFQLATLDLNRGRLAAAAAAYEALLHDPLCPPAVWVKAANNLSNAQTQLGRPHAALDHLERAAELAKDLGPFLQAVIANSRAWSSFHAGRWAESVGRFEEAGKLHAAAGLPLGEHFLDYADVLRDLRLLDEAATAARSAAEDFERHRARLMAAEARLRCARLALERDDPATALVDAESAIHDFRRQRRPAWTARAVVTAVEARAVLQNGHSREGLEQLRRAAATLRRLGLRAEASYAYLTAGRAALALRQPAARNDLELAGDLARGQAMLVRLRGHLARALLAAAEQPDRVVPECARGLRDLAQHRSALPSLELRVLAAGHGMELGELGLRALLPTASPSRILEWVERTRTAALLRVQPPAAGVDEDVLALRRIEHELRAARFERGEEPPALLARQTAVEARIRRASWAGDTAVGPTAATVSSAEIRRSLPGGWLVEYVVTDQRVLALVLGPRRTRIVDLGPVAPVRREVDAVLFALRRLLRGTQFAGAAMTAAGRALSELSTLVMEPLDVPPDVPLVVVPSVRLLGVPWSALRQAPVAVAASGTLWVRSRRAAPNGRTRVALVAGPGLPGAAAEIEAVQAEYPGAHALLPPDSTVEATVGLVKESDLAHIACHGKFRSDSPLFSALELSDGALTLYELLARGVAPHQVVLASCNSGAERTYAGNEVIGFVSAMMSGGTAGIAATEIPIPDGACAALMTVLHRHLGRGDSLMSAVWHARAALADGGPEEYVAWFGLTAYGSA